MKILVTGFEPFGGEAVNPAQQAVRLLPDDIGGAKIVRQELPVVFGTSGDIAVSAIRREQPDAVVCVGQAGGRAKITVERVAINVDDARMPDNAGNCPVDEPIVNGAPDAYFATLPIKTVVAAMQDAGVPAEVSNSAGTYVCNHLMYRVLHETRASSVRAGFIHVPFVPEQTENRPNVPSLPLEEIVKGLTAAIKSLV